MPFCKVTLKCQKPASIAYPKKLKTLGDHLRKKRLDLRIQQEEVAKKLNTSTTSIYNWENNRTSPSLYSIPKIIKFLGYIPASLKARSLGEKIATSRRLLDLTQKKSAHCLKIDPSTLARWEKGESRPSKKQQEKLNALFTSLPSGHPSLPLKLLFLKSLKRKNPS